ncbi:RhoGEF domain [Plasmodiophora brassicae]
MLSSERSFVASLTQLATVVIPRLNEAPHLQALISDARVALMFGSAEQVLSLNGQLVHDLTVAVEDGTTPCTPASVAAIFEQYAPLFSIYTTYATHYGHALPVLVQQAEQIDLALRNISMQGQTLFSLGIMPIQRVPRYALLLRELLKETKGDPDVQRALAVTEQAAASINEAIRAAETRDEMLKRVKGKAQALIATGHQLLRTGALSKMDRNGNFKRHTFMLFADQLRYGGHNERSVPLHGCTVARDTFELKRRGLAGTAFVLQTTTKSFIVQADTEDDASAWMAAIDEAARLAPATGGADTDDDDGGTTAAPVMTRTDFCAVCAARFSMLVRPRHCARCGRSVCPSCCLKMPSTSSRPGLVCALCRPSDPVTTTSSTSTSTSSAHHHAAPSSTSVPASGGASTPRNHFAIALQELKAKVAVVPPSVDLPETTPDAPAEPARHHDEPTRLSPRRALGRIFKGGSRSSSNAASESASSAASRATSIGEPAVIVSAVRAQHDLLAEVQARLGVPAPAPVQPVPSGAALPDQGPPPVAIAITPVTSSSSSGSISHAAISSYDDARQALLASEAAYATQLDDIARVFANPLLQDVSCASLPPSLAIVFDTIGNLRTVHGQLVQSVVAGADLGDALLKFSHLSKRFYVMFAKHYGEGVAGFAEEDGASSVFQRIVQCGRQYDAGAVSGPLLLNKWLVGPLRRVPTYVSLIDRTMAVAPSPALQAAQQSVGDTWARMSEIMEMRAQYETLLSLERRFERGGSGLVDLAVPNRRLVRWGVLDKFDRHGKAESLAFHLFTDVLIYSQIVGDNFRLRRRLDLAQCTVAQTGKNAKAKYDLSFQVRVKGTAKTIIVGAGTPDDKDAWIKDIMACIARQEAHQRKISSTTGAGGQTADDVTSTTVASTWADTATAASTMVPLADPGSGAARAAADPSRYAMFYEEDDAPVKARNDDDDDGGGVGANVQADPEAAERHPKEVDSLWARYLTDAGEEYYHDAVTGRSTWTKPKNLL